MLIYKKTLSLSLRASDPREMLSANLVDHITVDANNLFFYMYTFNLVWALPLKVRLNCSIFSEEMCAIFCNLPNLRAA